MNEMSKNLNHILQKELMEDYHHSRDQNEESNVTIKQYQKFYQKILIKWLIISGKWKKQQKIL